MAVAWYNKTVKQDERYRVIVAGSFGSYTALMIGVVSDEIHQITVLDGNGREGSIAAHCSQFSVMFEIFVPQTEQEMMEKPFIGFTQPKESMA